MEKKSTINYKEAIKDIAGFLQWCMDNKKLLEEETRFTLIHDICGLAREEKGFSLRTSGYGQYFKG